MLPHTTSDIALSVRCRAGQYLARIGRKDWILLGFGQQATCKHNYDFHHNGIAISVSAKSSQQVERWLDVASSNKRPSFWMLFGWCCCIHCNDIPYEGSMSREARFIMSPKCHPCFQSLIMLKTSYISIRCPQPTIDWQQIVGCSFVAPSTMQ